MLHKCLITVAAVFVFIVFCEHNTFSEDQSCLPANTDSAIIAAQIFVIPHTDYDTYFKNIRNAGYNTVIFRVFQNPGDRHHFLLKEHPIKCGVYFKTNKAPVVLNILNIISGAAHRNNLKIFAWMTSREMKWDFPGKVEITETVYNPETDSYEKGSGIDIFNPEAIRYITGLYCDLAAHNIDGILFQDDLVLKHTTGFGDFASAEFFDRTGVELKADNLYRFSENPVRKISGYLDPFDAWCRIKAQKIISLVNCIAVNARKVNKNLKIALNVYYDTILNPKNGLHWLSQDVELWKNNNEIDYFMIMAYHRQIGKELNIDGDSAVQRVISMPDILSEWIEVPERYIIKLQTIDWESGEMISREELSYLINGLCGNKHRSFALAPYTDELADFKVYSDRK